jgi:hypothetical protein
MVKPRRGEPSIKELKIMRDRFKKRRIRQKVQYEHPITGERVHDSEFGAYLTHQAVIEGKKRRG